MRTFKKRSWFGRFKLRTLFLFMTLCAAFLAGMQVDREMRFQTAAEIESLRSELQTARRKLAQERARSMRVSLDYWLQLGAMRSQVVAHDKKCEVEQSRRRLLEVQNEQLKLQFEREARRRTTQMQMEMELQQQRQLQQDMEEEGFVPPPTNL